MCVTAPSHLRDIKRSTLPVVSAAEIQQKQSRSHANRIKSMAAT